MTEQPLVLQSIQFLPNFASWNSVINECILNSSFTQLFKKEGKKKKNNKKDSSNRYAQATDADLEWICFGLYCIKIFKTDPVSRNWNSLMGQQSPTQFSLEELKTSFQGLVPTEAPVGNLRRNHPRGKHYRPRSQCWPWCLWHSLTVLSQYLFQVSHHWPDPFPGWCGDQLAETPAQLAPPVLLPDSGLNCSSWESQERSSVQRSCWQAELWAIRVI